MHLDRNLEVVLKNILEVSQEPEPRRNKCDPQYEVTRSVLLKGESLAVGYLHQCVLVKNTRIELVLFTIGWIGFRISLSDKLLRCYSLRSSTPATCDFIGDNYATFNYGRHGEKDGKSIIINMIICTFRYQILCTFYIKMKWIFSEAVQFKILKYE